MSKLKITNARRKQRVRLSLRRTANGRPRLSIFRSSKHIYAQVIDDLKGETIASASSLEKAMRDTGKTGADVDAAQAVGKLLAERAVKNGVKEVIFDRGQYLYHGRVKALADAAREGGLSF
jgi:large subunit ribosomal protein L18